MTSPGPTSRTSSHQDECEDADRIAEIYEQYSSRIATYALRRTNRVDAADVVAETFLIAWRRRDVVPDEPMVLPWLYGVARRVLCNQRRSHRRRGRLHNRLTNQFDDSIDPSTYAESVERYESICTALGRLSDADAEILRLTAWESLTPAEIASVLDLDARAVRQRLHRARRRLRRQLGIQEAPRHVRAARHSRPTTPPIGAFLWDLSD